MPIFEYKCESCGEEFELFFKPGEDIEKEAICPKCGSESKKMPTTNVAFKFKGPGFYETDYKQKDKKPTGSDDKNEEDDS